MPERLFRRYKTPAFIAKAAVIAAAYAALTLLFAPISYGEVQFRLSESLCVLPFFFPEAVPGLFVGCVVANLFSPHHVILDVVFGSVATLLAAFCTAYCAKFGQRGKWLAPLPPVLFNAFIISAVIAFSATRERGAFAAAFLWNALLIGFSELVIVYGLGMPVLFFTENFINRKTKE